MRTPEDRIKVRVTMQVVVDLDRERIVEDPLWANAESYDLNDPEQVQRALFTYLASYVHRQRLFGEQIFMPSTNGPADISVINMEEVTNGNGSGDPRGEDR